MFRSLVPWRNRLPATFPSLVDEMEDLMSRALTDTGNGWPPAGFNPSVNVAETDGGYEVTAELPGMKPEEVNVELHEGALWISGHKSEEKEEQGKSFHRVERRSGEFRRMVQLPGAVNEGEVDATYKDGVLTVRVPKTERAQTRRIPVKG